MHGWFSQPASAQTRSVVVRALATGAMEAQIYVVCAQRVKKKDVIEPEVAAVFGAANLVCPLRWATLAQRLCLLHLNAAGLHALCYGTLAKLVCYCTVLCFTFVHRGTL